ncbi:MAG: rod shape-determining protein MreC [Candidatus Kerfeldbacteria bacterium]|nr:rod shape-determining protein MreC [Candidatus Kerfeldbacteria bacterium]
MAILEQRIAELNVENAQLQSALEAAVEADEQERFLKTRQFEGVAARLVARSGDPTSEFVTVDRGTRAGIQIDAPAIVAGGVIIGRVIAVTDDISRILLSTDNRSSFAGVSLQSTTTQGLVSGARGLSLSMGLISQSEHIEAGDIIVTSGVDSGVPRGLVLGEVERVDRQTGALFQSASLRPLFQSNRLDVITILTTNQ